MRKTGDLERELASADSHLLALKAEVERLEGRIGALDGAQDAGAYREAAVRIAAILHRRHRMLDGTGLPWTACPRVDCVEARVALVIARGEKLATPPNPG